MDGALDNRGKSAAKSLVYSLLNPELARPLTPLGRSCISATRNPDPESFLHL